MISEAYELFGCNTADLFVMSVNTGDSNAECILFDDTYGIEFPCISGIEGGGTAINNTYGIGAYPTYILIAPNHDIVEQDMWPISSTQTFVNYFENNGLMQAECGSVLTAAFSSDATDICQYDEVNFMDMSSGNITSWNWTFQGGDPATSTEQNPIVTYNQVGTFDVQLEVSDGTDNNILLIENYMNVDITPPVMLNPFDDVCFGWPAFELTGGSPTGGTYSGTGVNNGWFDPSVAGVGTHTITYTYTGLSGCENSEEETILVDPCTGIGDIESIVLKLYPNPSDGRFGLEINYHGTVAIQITNILGKIIYTENIFVNDNLTKTMDLRNVEEGIYFVTLSTSENTTTQKLKLIN